MQLGFAPFQLKKKAALFNSAIQHGTQKYKKEKKHTNKPLLDEKKRYSHCRTRRDCGGEERKKRRQYSPGVERFVMAQRLVGGGRVFNY